MGRTPDTSLVSRSKIWLVSFIEAHKL